MKTHLTLKGVFIIFIFLLSSSTMLGQITIGPFTFYSTNQGGVVLGQAQINGSVCEAGDVIAAYDPYGNCVGAQELTIFGGLAYINLTIYGDDGGGNGMSGGEAFFLHLYDASSGDIILYDVGISGWQNTNFTPISGLNDPNTVYNFIVQTASPPTVATKSASNITSNSAQSGGIISNNGGATVTARGVCWNTSGSPDLGDSFTTDGSGTGSYNSLLNGLMASTTYYIKAYATNSEGTSYGSEKMFTTLASGQAHFETVWTTPFQAMSIFVTTATIDAANMVAGEEVGVFDIDPDTGDEICVGAGELTEVLVGGVFLEIIVSMDDGIGQTNGFQSGNDMIFKLYSPSVGEVDIVSIEFPWPGYDEVFAPLGTSVVDLFGITTITQNIDIVAGWNLVSFRAIPDNLDMLSIFDPVIVDANLVKVLDQDGNSIVHLPFPPPTGQWNNSIGDLTMEQGYYVNVDEFSSLTIQAPPVEVPFTIQLRLGWNIISMPCGESQDAETVLQTLISNNKLVKVINDEGQSIVKLPFPPPNGQWNFGFDAFYPGEGYYVKVSQATSLTFDCNALAAMKAMAAVTSELSYFTPAYSNNPYMPMSVALQLGEGVATGDEVAVFDGEICVGAAKVTNDNLIVIPVSMDDPLTENIDGYLEGNTISVQVWSEKTGVVYENVAIEYIIGSETFSALDTYAGSLQLTLTGFSNASNSNEFGLEVYPNPFSEIALISYSLPTSSNVEIELFNIHGKQVKMFINEHHEAGMHSLKMNREDYKSGTYLLSFKAEGINHYSEMKKIIIY